MASARQQTNTELALQNLVNMLARQAGIRDVPVVRLRDSHYFSYQPDVEHQFAEFVPDDDTLYVNHELASGFGDPTASLLNTGNILKVGMLLGGMPSNVLEVALRHQMIHVSLYHQTTDDIVALGHGPEFLRAAAKLGIPPFELKDNTSAATANMSASLNKAAAAMNRKAAEWRAQTDRREAIMKRMFLVALGIVIVLVFLKAVGIWNPA